MNWKQVYTSWIENVHLDEELKEALANIKADEKQLEDCFYKNLEFGTGGMRGEIGPGTNRMNLYTIRKASKGFADYITLQVKKRKRKELLSLTIQDINRQNLRWKLLKRLQLKGLKHTYLMSFAQRRSYLLQFVN